jgi:hypothetical protein
MELVDILVDEIEILSFASPIVVAFLISSVAFTPTYLPVENEGYLLKPRITNWTKQFFTSLSILTILFHLLVTEKTFFNELCSISFSFLLILIFQSYCFYESASTFFKCIWLIPYLTATIALTSIAYQLYFPSKLSSLLLVFSSIFSCIGFIFSFLNLFEKPKFQNNEPTEEFTCDMLSYTSFSFMNNVIKVAQTKETLELEDIPEFCDEDTCIDIYRKVNYSEGDEITFNGILSKLYRVISREFTLQGMFQLLASLTGYLAPLALQGVLLHISSFSTNESSLSNQSTTDSTTKINTTSTFNSTDYVYNNLYYPPIHSQYIIPLLIIHPSSSSNIHMSDSNHRTLAATAALPATSLVSWMSVEVAVALMFIGPLIQTVCLGQNYTRARRNCGKLSITSTLNPLAP